MKPFLTLLPFMCIITITNAQHVDFYGNAVTDKVCAQYAMKDDKEVQDCMDKICEAADIPNNFVLVPCPNINNCFALFENDVEYIVYDINFFNRVKTFGFTEKNLPNNVDWAALTVLAHELGHHVYQHTTNKLVREKYTPVQMELQADEYAGTVLYKLGATLAQAQKAMCSDDVPEEATFTHPARANRLAAIAKGWQREYAKAAKNQQTVTPGTQSSVSNPRPSDSVGLVQPTTQPPATDNPQPPANLQNTVLVQGGTFNMGGNTSDNNDDEKPVHQVTVSSFFISKYPVTVEEFNKFVQATQYVTTAETEGQSYVYTDNEFHEKSGVNWRYDANGNKHGTLQGNKLPVVHVSWYDATKYCEWVSSNMHITCRLPAEAEWEYAALGGSKTNSYMYSGSNTINDVAWYLDNSGNTAHPVGQKQPNELGLYDMTGNVWQWCSDWYGADYYGSSPVQNPQGPATGYNRVVRGGGFSNMSRNCRAANRLANLPDTRGADIGFRVVVSP